MPRRAGIAVPGMAWHIIQRGNNRSACFYADKDYQYYLAVNLMMGVHVVTRDGTNG